MTLPHILFRALSNINYAITYHQLIQLKAIAAMAISLISIMLRFRFCDYSYYTAIGRCHFSFITAFRREIFYFCILERAFTLHTGTIYFTKELFHFCWCAFIYITHRLDAAITGFAFYTSLLAWWQLRFDFTPPLTYRALPAARDMPGIFSRAYRLYDSLHSISYHFATLLHFRSCHFTSIWHLTWIYWRSLYFVHFAAADFALRRFLARFRLYHARFRHIVESYRFTLFHNYCTISLILFCHVDAPLELVIASGSRLGYF